MKSHVESPMTPLLLTLSDLERSNSKSLAFWSLASHKGAQSSSTYRVQHILDFVFRPKLKTEGSSASHLCPSRGHLNRCCIVCGSEPHTQVTSWLSRYPHFLSVPLQWPLPHLNRLRHFHSARLESAPDGSSSLTPIWTWILSVGGWQACLPMGWPWS